MHPLPHLYKILCYSQAKLCYALATSVLFSGKYAIKFQRKLPSLPPSMEAVLLLITTHIPLSRSAAIDRLCNQRLSSYANSHRGEGKVVLITDSLWQIHANTSQHPLPQQKLGLSKVIKSTSWLQPMFNQHSRLFQRPKG